MLKLLHSLIFILILLLTGGCRQNKQTEAGVDNGTGVMLELPDIELYRSFRWAKAQALQYVHRGNDPAGLWYEASLPGRNAFCMRDVAHQSTGAWLLGMHEWNKNMFRKFAEGISDSRDWCSFWEINKYNRPAPADYLDDKNFWYNLPANYDLTNACCRMFRWSGDSALLRDTVFLNFYDHTLNDYTERWKLRPEEIPERPGFLNRKSFDPDKVFQVCRGIPSYHEGEPGKTRVGIDLLAFQAASCRAVASLSAWTGNTASSSEYRKRIVQLTRLISTLFYDSTAHKFYDLLLTDGHRSIDGMMKMYVLYNRISIPPEQQVAILKQMRNEPRPGIELLSHYPEIFYRYDLNDAAAELLKYLTDPATPRRTYPENSFAVVSAFVTGMMGLEPGNDTLFTLSRLPSYVPWARVNHIPYRKSKLNLYHEGDYKTVLENLGKESITWCACFYGTSQKIRVNGNEQPAVTKVTPSGKQISSVTLRVKPGGKVEMTKS